MSLIQAGYQSTLSGAMNAIEANDIERIRKLLMSPGLLEMEKAGELLVLALELDRRDMAKELIERDVSLHSTNDEISTCLTLAAKKNNLECLDMIIRRQQINVNATDLFGWTALMYSCYYGYGDITKSLLLAGAQADVYDNDHMTSLIWASGRGHADCVSKLIQFGRAKVNLVDKCETSALIWACRKGYTEVASILIKAGANIDSTGMFGWSALLVAVRGNHVETLKLLLQHKPNVNTCDTHRYTPLITASKEGRVEIVRLLLKARAFVSLYDEDGHTALIHATKNGHLEVVDLLLKHHANIDHVGIDKKTALFWAVEKGNLNMVERLLQGKPNTELVSKDGETCLIKAVKLKKFSIVRVLLAHQARVSPTDKNGDNVLHMAARLRSATLAELLLANTKSYHLLKQTNKAKKTPIDVDNENELKIFPALLATHKSRASTKVSDTAFSNSNFHLDDTSIKMPPPRSLSEESQASSSSLVKKLASALNHQPQSQTRVLV